MRQFVRRHIISPCAGGALSSDPVAAVARIAETLHESGQSLQVTIRAVRYKDIRAQLRTQDLSHYLRTHPELIEKWHHFSQDKRTGGGWYFEVSERGAWVGQVGPDTPLPFADSADACAEYILRELDSVGA